MSLSYDPEFAAAIAPMATKTGPKHNLAIGDIEGRRAQDKQTMEAVAALSRHDTAALDVTRIDHSVSTADGSKIIVAEFFRGPERASPSKGVVYFHGGGMIRGSVDAFDMLTRMRCDQTGIPFFSVEYRLAPEHRFPTSAEDCFTALEWVYQNADRLHVHKDGIIIMGESAGGGLAGEHSEGLDDNDRQLVLRLSAAVALMARDRQLNPPLKKQILIFPMLDDRNLKPLPGIEELAVWKCDDNITGWGAYLGDAAGSLDESVPAYAAPARVASVDGLPPTYIECGQLDIFSFENMRYATRLLEARIPTELHIYPGQPHGFMLLAPHTRYSRLASSNVMAAISEA